MSQRNSGYQRREADLYETPAWVTHALCDHIDVNGRNIWEPACGSGQMVMALYDHGAVVCGTDIRQDPPDDFLARSHAGASCMIITNPPYELAREFCEHALKLMQPVQGRVAMLLRTDFDHAVSRSHLFRCCPAFAKKLVLTKRIAWFVEANGKPKASPSFNHAWYIWDWKHEGPPTIAYGPIGGTFNQNLSLPTARKSPIRASHADLFTQRPSTAQRPPQGASTASHEESLSDGRGSILSGAAP